MYRSETLRTLAGLLLCLPIVHLALIVSADVSDYLDPSPEVWADDIAAIVERDMGTALPANPVIVIGGHRVRLWKDLTASLAPRAVLLRPLGDATLEDLAYHFDRLAAFYRPEVLVIFPGYADLHIRDQKTPEDFKRSMRDLLTLDEEYGSAAWRYVIAPVQMPLHPSDEARISKITEYLQALTKEMPNLTVVDPNPLLRGLDGKPNPDYYLGDGINLSPSGYARISMLLTSELNQGPTIGAQ